jgi:hypothetical protein
MSDATPITSHRPMDGHNLITLRLECLKLALDSIDRLHRSDDSPFTLFNMADSFLHYVLNGSEKETGR